MAQFTCAHDSGHTGRGPCSRPAKFCARCCRTQSINTDFFTCSRHQLTPAQLAQRALNQANSVQGQHQQPPQQQQQQEQQQQQQQPLQPSLPPLGPQPHQQPPQLQPAGPNQLSQSASIQQAIQLLQAQGYVLNPPGQGAGGVGQQLPPPPSAPIFPPFPGGPHALNAPQPPHLNAFNGGQPVSPWHTYTAVNSNNTYVQPRGHDSGGRSSTLFSSMSAGLAPALPGQVGPTIEQLLDRRTREWKPYRNAAEFKEALDDWYLVILRTHPGDTARNKAAHDYVVETTSMIDKVGWVKVYDYHKAAFKAAGKDPPQYDPLTSGPIYHFAYLTLIHPHLPSPSKPSTHKAGATAKRSVDGVATRPVTRLLEVAAEYLNSTQRWSQGNIGYISNVISECITTLS